MTLNNNKHLFILQSNLYNKMMYRHPNVLISFDLVCLSNGISTPDGLVNAEAGFICKYLLIIVTIFPILHCIFLCNLVSNHFLSNFI